MGLSPCFEFQSTVLYRNTILIGGFVYQLPKKRRTGISTERWAKMMVARTITFGVVARVIKFPDQG